MNGAKSKKPKVSRKFKPKATKPYKRSGFAKSGGVQKRFPIFGSVNTKVQRTDNWIPPRQLTKIRYAENFAISASGTLGTTAINYIYSLTGAFDPRINLGGGQPVNWDYLVLQYDRYLVLGAKVKVSFNNPSHDGMIVGVRLRHNSDGTVTAGQTVDNLLMNRDLTKISWMNNTGSQLKTFEFYVKPWQILGIRKETYKSDIAFGALVTTTPAQFPILEPFCAHSVAGEDAVIRCYVEIQYYVMFSEKNTIFDA